MLKLLQTLLSEFEIKLKSSEDAEPRDYSFPEIKNKIKVAIGMRRVGKTYFLFQTIHQLLNSSIPLSRILYINFEDDRLLPLSQEDLANLLESFYSLYPENHDQQCFFYLDEIQNIEGWALVVRRFLDSKPINIVLSGSSSKLLSREIATSLRGRAISTEIWPYSFTEYLHAINFNIPKLLDSKRSQDQLMSHLIDYLNLGGFPEILGSNPVDATQVLQEYVDVAVYRDIIERHKISNTALIKYLIKTLIKNAATNFSINKFFKDIKSQGFSASKTTIFEYLEYIEEAYLAYQVPLYTDSIRKSQTNPKKIYTTDPGLINAFSIDGDRSLGRLFENLVYLDLRRDRGDIYYYLTEERYEVDFVVKTADRKLALYQVVWDISDEATLERETRALKAAEKELGIKGKLITPTEYFRWRLSAV